MPSTNPICQKRKSTGAKAARKLLLKLTLKMLVAAFFLPPTRPRREGLSLFDALLLPAYFACLLQRRL